MPDQATGSGIFVVRVVVAAIGAVLLLGAFGLLVFGITSAKPPPPLIENLSHAPPHERQNALAPSTQEDPGFLKRCQSNPVPMVLVEVTTVDLQAERATFTLAFCGSVTNVVDALAQGHVTGLNGTVRFVPFGAGLVTERLHPLTRIQLTEATVHAVTFGSIEVSSLGSPTLYPFDSYRAATVGHVEVVTTGPGAGTFTLPSAPVVIDGSALQPLHTDAVVYRSSANGDFAVGVLERRPDSVKIYILLLAAIPLVLALLMFLVVYARRRDGRVESLGAVELAGIGALLLAILPIRQVLVPPGETQLTLVDYILGFEMAALVAFACIAVSVGMGRAARVASTSGE